MTACFIATCRLPAVDSVYTRGDVKRLVCQPHYDAIMLVLGEQAGRPTKATP